MNTENRRALFLGSKKFGLNVFKELYRTSKKLEWTILYPDDSHDSRSNYDEFVDYAEHNFITLIQVRSKEHSIEIWKSIAPDVVFVCGWYWLIDSNCLNEVPLGTWGIHNSLLPLYRGGSPLVWSIIDGAENTGYSVFRLVAKMDAGPVLYQRKIDLSLEDSISDAIDLIEQDVLGKLSKLWDDILQAKAQTSEQNQKIATYARQRSEKDGIIDWTKSAFSIHNFIRAQSKPYPGAFTNLRNTKIRIYKSRILDVETSLTIPLKTGQVLEKYNDSFVVSCGNHTALIILEYEIYDSKCSFELGSIFD